MSSNSESQDSWDDAVSDSGDVALASSVNNKASATTVGGGVRRRAQQLAADGERANRSQSKSKESVAQEESGSSESSSDSSGIEPGAPELNATALEAHPAAHFDKLEEARIEDGGRPQEAQDMVK